MCPSLVRPPASSAGRASASAPRVRLLSQAGQRHAHMNRRPHLWRRSQARRQGGEAHLAAGGPARRPRRPARLVLAHAPDGGGGTRGPASHRPRRAAPDTAARLGGGGARARLALQAQQRFAAVTYPFQVLHAEAASCEQRLFPPLAVNRSSTPRRTKSRYPRRRRGSSRLRASRPSAGCGLSLASSTRCACGRPSQVSRRLFTREA